MDTLRFMLSSLWKFAVGIAIGMMLCAAVVGFGRLVYWLAYALWGPG